MGLLALSVVAASSHVGPPDAPTATVSNKAADDSALTLTQLRVSWDVPDNNGSVITSFTVQWKSGTQDYLAAREVTTADATTTTITFGDGGAPAPADAALTTGTEYTVRVRANNSYDDGDANTDNDGYGAWSAEVTGTPAAVPTAPTLADANVTAGNTQLVVSWAAPEDNGLDITGYTVQWKSGTQDYLASRQADVTGTSHTIPNLMNGEEYTVRVRATNGVGNSEWSTEVMETPAAVPDAPTATVSNKAADDSALTLTQLRVSWDAPAANGATIASYTVQWKSGTQDYGSDRQATTGDATEASRSNTFGDSTGFPALTTGTEYTVRVRANVDVAEEVWGPWSAEVTGTPAAVPTAPTLADANVTAGNTQLVVSWAAPEDNGLDITGYTVQWKSGTQDYLASRQADVTGTSHTIPNLMNDTEYTVRVRATNGIGNSEWSTEVMETPAAVPDAPVVTVSNDDGATPPVALTLTQLRVSWDAPAANGSVIASYTVQWKSGAQNYGSSREVTTGDAATTSISFGVTGSPAPADAALTTGTEYTVRVRANVDVAEEVWGPWSAEVIGTPAALPGVPGAAADEEVTVTAGNAQLTVKWDAPPANGSAITGYRVQWRVTDTNEPMSVYSSSRQADVTGTSHTILGLENGTGYTVQVRATNGIGDSEYSAGTTGTPAAAPDAPMVTVSNDDGATPPVALEATQLRVSWAAPEDNGSDITSYTVQWKSGAQNYGSSREVTTGDAATTSISFGVTGSPAPADAALTTGTEYTVRVRANNSYDDGDANTDNDGYGAWSAEVTGTPAALPGVPGAAADEEVTVTAGYAQLTVKWDAPPANGSAITGYRVQWRVTDTNEPMSAYSSSRQADVTGTSHTILGLENGTEYTVQVRATNGIGDSEYSAGTTGTPLASLGAVPDAPAVDVMAGNAQLMVSWDAPAANGAMITGYTVQWKSGDQDYGSDRQADVTDTSHTIMNLMNGTEYTVQVIATNAVGNSEAGTAMGTPAAVPDAPGNVAIEPGNEQLEVSWGAPTANHPGGITSYTVQWKSGTEVYDAGASPPRHAVVGVDVTSYTIVNLEPGTEYTVQVFATNAVGDGPGAEAMGSVPAPPSTKTSTPSTSSDDDEDDAPSAPAPAAAPAMQLFSASNGAVTVTERQDAPGQSSLMFQRHDGGASFSVPIGWISSDGQTVIATGFIRDEGLGQTYAIVRRESDGMIVRLWVAPDSPLVYSVPWADVNANYTVPTAVLVVIPLDDQNPAPNQLTRRFDGGDDRIFSYDASIGQWRHVPDLGTFQAAGFYWCDVTAADAGFFGRASTGPAHPSSGTAPSADYPSCRTS